MAETALPLASLEDGQGWPAQGEWTYEDYLRLPDDGQRYEVIRGVLYVAPAPNYDHQLAHSQLFRALSNYIVENRLGVLLSAPFDVILPEGIATPVEPDLLFIKEEDRPRRGDKNFEGVPDLLVEILSPSTRSYDRKTKLAAYRDAGVPELWLVDPQTFSVVIYGWKDEQFTELERGGEGDEVGSVILPGFRVQVGQLFR
jgi:Uma2 family endonuclease